MEPAQEEKKISLNEVLAACAVDQEFRQSFLENPRSVFDALGIDYMAGYDLRAIEVPEKTFVIGIGPMHSAME